MSGYLVAQSAACPAVHDGSISGWPAVALVLLFVLVLVALVVLLVRRDRFGRKS